MRSICAECEHEQHTCCMTRYLYIRGEIKKRTVRGLPSPDVLFSTHTHDSWLCHDYPPAPGVFKVTTP